MPRPAATPTDPAARDLARTAAAVLSDLLAADAALAGELAAQTIRRAVQRATSSEDRERIARAVHDLLADRDQLTLAAIADAALEGARHG